jgi:hypothetical protein
MGKERTQTGAYSESSFGGKGSKDKVRSVSIGPAEGVVKNPYSVKDFSHLDDQYKGESQGLSGPVPTKSGKVAGRSGAFNSGRQDVKADMSDKFLGPRRRKAGDWE